MRPRILCALTAAALAFCSVTGMTAGADDTISHDPSRDVQTEGVGNPFNYGERNTPADASTEEIRRINSEMTVQEVKYALYKEIDEHWDLLRVRLGEPEREKVYALFLGLGSRESTLGEGRHGADVETAFAQGFGVSSAHSYGTLQTAVTAFEGCDPTFMKEDNVPEMYQYTLSESTFYDAIISDHMGIRKLMHFVEIAINEEGMTGYDVVRGALKGFNQGWCNYTPDNEAYYKDYPDEIIAMAHWYYDNGHLYDNVFTWTQNTETEPYRTNAWDWWSDCSPSMAEITASSDPATEPPTEAVTAEPTTGGIVPGPPYQMGDVNLSYSVDVADLVLLSRYLLGAEGLTQNQATVADIDFSGTVDTFDLVQLRKLLTR